MNWLNDLNNAMDLIEERLPGEVSLEELARAAGCSAFHLQRMFPYLTGLTLADYLRRRRLSLAAHRQARLSSRTRLGGELLLRHSQVIALQRPRCKQRSPSLRRAPVLCCKCTKLTSR